jgi:alcohol dehydrogenase class IV
MDYMKKAYELMEGFKGGSYTHGRGVLESFGEVAQKAGKSAVLVRDTFPGSDDYINKITEQLDNKGIKLLATVPGPGPNAPLEDLARISGELKKYDPEFVISFGGGSTIDVLKSAEVLRTLGGDIEDYFGTGNVTSKLKETGKKLCPHIAIQTVASSGAQLTKYSNITNVQTGQKKLVVDEAIVPTYPIFDYSVTYKAPKNLTMDGALDGIAHCLEVVFGSVSNENYPKIKEVAETGISLVVDNIGKVVDNPDDKDARDALCMATDIGGYAIMLGGTNGAHLTSFSLVDILSHGRACAMMNPYYTAFFAPAVEDPLKMVGKIYERAGYTEGSVENLSGRELGEAVAKAMLRLSERIGFPTRLEQVDGFTQAHITKALKAAKNPQLKMKLQNMPIPLSAEQVDEYMGPILEAAKTGDISLIKNM